MRSFLRTALTVGLLSTYACSGSISCTSCGSGPLDPIPGGFDPAAQIEKAAQVRLNQRGLDFVESEFQNLVGAFVSMECGQATDPPCPTGFVTNPGGAANPSTCDTIQGVCVESASGSPGPLLGFEIPRTVQSGATICRDDANDPNRRDCFAYVRFEDLALRPMGPNELQATVTVQIHTNGIPFRYDALGMDCVVTLDSNSDGNPLQDLVVVATIGEWNAPSGNGGRQLDVDIVSVDAQIPDGDVDIVRDPIHGGADDILTCGIANLGTVKNILIPQLTGSLADLVGEEVDKATGWRCGGATTPPCPAQTTCNTDFLCEEDATGDIVPVKLGVEGRLDLGALLAGFSPGRPGQGDISFLVGGESGVDSSGVTLGALGGAEVVTPDMSCAQILPSPRTRPGFVPPPDLPADAMVDLDFDGTPETEYMVAAGISEALVRQYLWTIYTTGIFCTSVSANEVDLLNTGSLGLLMPSLAKLTHNDKYRWAIYPARISMFPGNEPQVRFGSGEVSGDPMDPTLVDPLIELSFDDLRIAFFAMVEERWVQLMVMQVDVNMGLGAMVTPANEVQLILGDVAGSITDVQISEHDILAEDPQELEDALPALLDFALSNFTGVLPTVPLPTAADLAGFEMNVLGVRGVEQGGSYPNLAVYADLGFDASQVPNLSVAAETVASVSEVRLPPLEAMAAKNGAARPEVVLDLAGFAPAGETLEHQVRVDGSMWSRFTTRDRLVLSRPSFSVQGHHRIEVRSRVKGRYRTLDPSPVVLDVLIDPEPPRLRARLVEEGVEVDAFDMVSGDDVTIEVIVDGREEVVAPGVVPVPASGELVVAATDEAGNRTERLLRAGLTAAGASEEQGGCRCVRPVSGSGTLGLLLFGLVFLRKKSK